jgi:hypothetical protein
MKKILLGCLAASTVVLIFSFTNSYSKDATKGNEDYCVSMTCNGKSIKETIHCFSSSEARSIAKAKYPHCTIGTIAHGACK